MHQFYTGFPQFSLLFSLLRDQEKSCLPSAAEKPGPPLTAEKPCPPSAGKRIRPLPRDPGLLSFTFLFVEDDRRSRRRLVKDRLGKIERHINTAVRTVGLIDLAAECLAPGRVMQSLSVEERHPVGYRCSVRLV